MQDHRYTDALKNLDSVIWKYENTGKVSFLSGQSSLLDFFYDDEIKDGEISLLKIVHPSDKRLLLRIYRKLQEKKDFIEVFRLKNKWNVYKWVKVKGCPFSSIDQDYVIGEVYDFTEQKKAEQLLLTVQCQMMELIENVPNPIAIHKEEKIAYMNPAGLNMLKVNKLDEVIGKKMVDFMGSKKESDNHSTLVAMDGKERDVVSNRFNILYNNEPHIMSFGSDITEQQNVKKRLDNLEYYDELTNLPNYKWFNERLSSLLTNSKRPFAIFFIGLNEFKVINTTFGFLIGDEILKSIANRLNGKLNENNDVFRIEGDTFSLIVNFQSKNQCSRLAEKIVKLISEPLLIQGQEFYLSPRIGISLYPEDGTELEALKKNSHAALYLAKEKDHNRIQFYNSDMKEMYARRIELEKGLRKAIKNKELYLLYQPKCCITNGEVVGAEALLRWKHPELGIISPLEFVPIAEESGLIDSIGEWVIAEACRQLNAWKDNGIDILMSVNLSVKQLHQPNLVEIVRTTLAQTKLRPENLELEITESIMQQSDHAIQLLYDLRDLGIKISIDDFGTGYSSLSYLKDLPIDTLKVDRTFIRDLELAENEKAKAIVKSIVEMGHNLQLTVIAEGVETISQIDFLHEIKCNQVQGYYISQPLAQLDFANWFFQTQGSHYFSANV
ncbi:EAL domain-containing protein [Bacillus sp. CGMCC 1.16607]|uniref:sensor domain-containing protein n=1 Tax=Bacillus sp. CGMCC 1.16607 TaxID=3351842 RepID=UPI00363543D3